MKPVIILFTCFAAQIILAQSEPVEVTPAIKKKIQHEVEREILKLKNELKEDENDSMETEFMLDTFGIEKYFDIFITYDFSAIGMRTVAYEVMNLYDGLLNKYNKKLLAKLKKEDQTTLIKAQKAWISYRDAEIKLTVTISKEQYSGGGTMQQLIDVSAYLKLLLQTSV